ncbi:hypothetical protein [Pedobacter antarcticus]|uniref:Crp/Fnr family transcriptional regulator n=1 Tax=Pedobacter antarcticus TaxID=34086 RepID=UPI002930EDE0|nr:hypothetical protein [Pedobacter antarcticus]
MNNLELIDFLTSLNPVNASLRLRLIEIIKTEHIKKRHFLQQAGAPADRIWFLEKGYMMGYKWKEDRKVPYRFWNETELILSAESFFLQKPAMEYIQAVNSSILKYITYEDLKLLSADFPEIHNYIQRIILDYEIFQEQRVYQFSANSALENYVILARNSAHVLRNVPVDNIAAFLGISRKTLNRIRAKTNLRSKNNPEDSV